LHLFLLLKCSTIHVVYSTGLLSKIFRQEGSQKETRKEKLNIKVIYIYRE
jgi:hypothetical protein